MRKKPEYAKYLMLAIIVVPMIVASFFALYVALK